jgi:hypothetical protein
VTGERAKWKYAYTFGEQAYYVAKGWRVGVWHRLPCGSGVWPLVREVPHG